MGRKQRCLPAKSPHGVVCGVQGDYVLGELERSLGFLVFSQDGPKIIHRLSDCHIHRAIKVMGNTGLLGLDFELKD